MKTQSAKAKGRRLQQLVVRDLLATFPHLGPDDVRSTSMGAGGEDVLLSTAARCAIPYSIEAKNQERVSIWSAIEQAQSNNRSHAHTAVVVFKKNGASPHVAVPWAHFLHLIRNGASSHAEPPSASATTPCAQAPTLGSITKELRTLADQLERVSQGGVEPGDGALRS